MLEAMIVLGLSLSVLLKNFILSGNRPVKLVIFRRADFMVLSVTMCTVVGLETQGPV